jgi:hypothetical protein
MDSSVGIKDVWASNLEIEMRVIEQLVEKYPYVSMVTFTLFRLTR